MVSNPQVDPAAAKVSDVSLIIVTYIRKSILFSPVVVCKVGINNIAIPFSQIFYGTINGSVFGIVLTLALKKVNAF